MEISINKLLQCIMSTVNETKGDMHASIPTGKTRKCFCSCVLICEIGDS
jgi:hypothetical protein